MCHLDYRTMQQWNSKWSLKKVMMDQQGTMHYAKIDTYDTRAINQGQLVSERYVIDSRGY